MPRSYFKRKRGGEPTENMPSADNDTYTPGAADDMNTMQQPYDDVEDGADDSMDNGADNGADNGMDNEYTKFNDGETTPTDVLAGPDVPSGTGGRRKRSFRGGRKSRKSRKSRSRR